MAGSIARNDQRHAYEQYIMQGASTIQGEKRMNNIWFLIDSIQQTLDRNDENTSVEDAIGRLILRDMLERNEEEKEDGDRVQLLTLHASKGLEYPHVFMMGMEEELLPHRTSIEEDNVEERRLAYVGIPVLADPSPSPLLENENSLEKSSILYQVVF